MTSPRKSAKISHARELDRQLLVPRQQIVEYHWSKWFINMSGVRGRNGKRITRTVAYLLKCPASSVPQAMRACKYSNKESSDAAKQMAVRRASKAALKKKKKSPPPVKSARRPRRRLCPQLHQKQHHVPYHLKNVSIRIDSTFKGLP
jgi:hypothetical protein